MMIGQVAKLARYNSAPADRRPDVTCYLQMANFADITLLEMHLKENPPRLSSALPPCVMQ